MGDKVTRQLLKTTDGKPSTGKNVKLRPAESLGAGSDINLPETPALSGIYRSVGDVPHGVYKEVIEDTETGETVSVEPGRACYAIYTDKTKTALVDRLLTDVARLSGFIADSSDMPSSDNLFDALSHAGNFKKTLIITDDVELSDSIGLAGTSLYIDLNGKTLTLNAHMSCDKAVIRNGKVRLMTGTRSINSTDGICWENVEFTQGATSQVTDDPNDRYINVLGMPATIPGTASTMPVVIGCRGITTAERLRFTTVTLAKLQNFIDNVYDNILSASNWLTETRRTKLDQFCAASDLTRSQFALDTFNGEAVVVKDVVADNLIRSVPLANQDSVSVNEFGTFAPGIPRRLGLYGRSSFHVGSLVEPTKEIDLETVPRQFIEVITGFAAAGHSIKIHGQAAASSGSSDIVYVGLRNVVGSQHTIDMLIHNGDEYVNYVTAPGTLRVLVWNYQGGWWVK
jgi:hypothetical protein